MRALFVLIVFVAIAWLAWMFRENLTRSVARFLPSQAPETPPASVTPDQPLAPIPAATPPPAPPGTYYATRRITNETPTGVKALQPGDEVKLMYRHKDGRMLVTNGRDEFLVKPEVLTKDRGEALRSAAP